MKMDLKTKGMKVQTGFYWLRTRYNGRLLWTLWYSFEFHKSRNAL